MTCCELKDLNFPFSDWFMGWRDADWNKYQSVNYCTPAQYSMSAHRASVTGESTFCWYVIELHNITYFSYYTIKSWNNNFYSCSGCTFFENKLFTIFNFKLSPNKRQFGWFRPKIKSLTSLLHWIDFDIVDTGSWDLSWALPVIHMSH